jgi:hypothetical protein
MRARAALTRLFIDPPGGLERAQTSKDRHADNDSG